MDFVLVLKNASLHDHIAKLGPGVLERLRNPPQAPINIDSPGIRHSISCYLSLEHASQKSYDGVMRSTCINFPGAEGVGECLSFKAMEAFVARYTGIEYVLHNMCLDSCVAFTGPFEDLNECPICGKSRWDEIKLRESNGQCKVPIRKFPTILLGPQLQAKYRDPDSARDMHWLHNRTRVILEEIRRTGTIPVIEDIAMGWDYLGAVLDGDIKPDNIVLVASLDGAQLYEDKDSDCWMYIFILVNLSPDKRYRKLQVLPGAFIPGPNKPKHLDSFLAIGFHHIAALQHEGLRVWDASQNIVSQPDVYLLFPTADGPVLVYWDGMVGHCGKNGCHVYCETRGRRKTRQSHYYPALLKPSDRACIGSDHNDINVFLIPPAGSQSYSNNLRNLISSPNQRQYELRRLETGISKPPLILGLHPTRSLGVPLCMATDIMHLAGNLSDLLISIWRGSMDCAPTDNIATWDWAVLRDEDVWKAHGCSVEDAGSAIPGSFDAKPRNIAEKINTDYKTWEFQLYMFGLGPALLYNVLPDCYWTNYCKLVRRFQLMCQHNITTDEVCTAYVLLCSWEREFEELYYQRHEDRLHFVRPCIHQVLHLAPETLQKGPPVCYAQWTMERTIRNIKHDIRQHKNYHENFAQQGIRRARINALLSVLPTLNETRKNLP